MADRQRAVAVGGANLLGGNDLVTREPGHDVHDTLVEGSFADFGARLANQRGDLVHHAPALGREVLGCGSLHPDNREQNRSGNNAYHGCGPKRADH